MTQLSLLEPRARCGYCGRELDRQPGGDFACARCRPALAAIRTVADWARFQREAAR